MKIDRKPSADFISKVEAVLKAHIEEADKAELAEITAAQKQWKSMTPLQRAMLKRQQKQQFKKEDDEAKRDADRVNRAEKFGEKIGRKAGDDLLGNGAPAHGSVHPVKVGGHSLKK